MKERYIYRDERKKKECGAKDAVLEGRFISTWRAVAEMHDVLFIVFDRV